ncbi:type II secretion system F family protein [Candidatus Gracilibacteria bacterium]|nr:type II secretion system F family protein [Candidatus Gracilibacteria bacterium]
MEDIIILGEEENKEFNIDSLSSHNKKSKDSMTFMDNLNAFVSSFQKIHTKDKIIFYRLMSTMLNAGMTLIKGISVLEKQEKNPLFKKMLGEMIIGLQEGKNLSDCLDVYPSSFSEAEIGVIRSGEKTGKLNEVMTSLADQVEKVASITGKLKGALIYPAMIMLVVLGVIAVMMIVVVPKLLEIFEDKSALPPSTQLLVFLSDFFVGYWYLLILFCIIVYFSITFYKKSPSGKYNWDSFVLHVPIFGSIVKKVTLSKFSRVFSGLMSSGVSVVESLKIVSEAVGNEVYRQRILLLLEDVRKGMKMWESLEGDKLFPDIMVQMIQVGEQSAKLDVTIIKVADFYDEQVDTMAATLNKLLEPFIIVFLAVVVGFIAIAIMQPIMNLADTVSQS